VDQFVAFQEFVDQFVLFQILMEHRMEQEAAVDVSHYWKNKWQP